MLLSRRRTAPFLFLCPPVRYDYRCLDCWARVTPAPPAPEMPEPRCSACGSARIVRVVWRLPVVRSRADGPEWLAQDPRPGAPGGENNGRKGG